MAVAKPHAADDVFYTDTVATTQPAQVKTGDSWVTYFTLFTARRKKAGDGSARCSAVQAGAQGVIAQCTRVLRTRQGQIALIGLDDWAGNSPWTNTSAIAGGTGRYTGITGSAQVTVTPQHYVIKLHKSR